MTSDKHELIGNFESLDKDVISRRDVLLMGAVAAGTLASAAPALAAGPSVAAAQTVAALETYVAKDFGHLTANKMEGLSASQIEQHLKLYKGYIAKANELTGKLKVADIAGANPTYAPFREMLIEESYAVNGVIYHELYFGNLGGKGGEPTGDFKAAVEERFASSAKFMDYLTAAGKCMRGWVVVGYNTRANHVATFGLDMHNMWSPANVVPLLVLDVYEHAYMIDYGIDRAKYLDAFTRNIDWDVVNKRFAMAKKHATLHDSTV